jgi:hypothetical protein
LLNYVQSRVFIVYFVILLVNLSLYKNIKNEEIHDLFALSFVFVRKLNP